MEYSSGIILHRKNGDNVEFFLCTPGGPYWEHRELWNFPKGHLESGETPFEAAVREFTEETAIPITNDKSKYKEEGDVLQNKHKIVYVFSKPYEGEDTSHCYSNETYSMFHGVKIIHGEISDYKWMTLDKIKESGMKCYIPIYERIINEYKCS